MSAKIRILIVDDHQIVRDGLRSLLLKEPFMEVIDEASDGRTAVRKARELQPDVVVMDVTMPDLNGIEAARQILHESPKIKVIALSMHDDRRFVINMLKSGVSGYLLKDCAYKELAQAIQVAVRTGKLYLSPGVTNVVVSNNVMGALCRNQQLIPFSPPENEK